MLSCNVYKGWREILRHKDSVSILLLLLLIFWIYFWAWDGQWQWRMVEQCTVVTFYQQHCFLASFWLMWFSMILCCCHKCKRDSISSNEWKCWWLHFTRCVDQELYYADVDKSFLVYLLWRSWCLWIPIEKLLTSKASQIYRFLFMDNVNKGNCILSPFDLNSLAHISLASFHREHIIRFTSNSK